MSHWASRSAVSDLRSFRCFLHFSAGTRRRLLIPLSDARQADFLCGRYLFLTLTELRG